MNITNIYTDSNGKVYYKYGIGNAAIELTDACRTTRYTTDFSQLKQVDSPYAGGVWSVKKYIKKVLLKL